MKIYETKVIQRISIRLVNPILIGMSILFILLGILSFGIISFNEVYFNTSWIIDTNLASQFGSFFQGFVGTIFAAAGSFLIAATFYAQFIEKKKSQIESMFFAMLEYHRDNVNNILINDYKYRIVNKKRVYEKIEGKRAFVLFKLQLFDCIDEVKNINEKESYNLTQKQIADIAYLSFYYGIDDKWPEFMHTYLNNYDERIANKMLERKNEILKTDKKNIGRTNQTTLGTYYRNMYNAIKMVDESIYLSKKEKYSLIKIYRAQLSNSELAILFFNLYGSNSPQLAASC